MLTLDTLEQIATKLSDAVPDDVKNFKADLKNNFQSILQASFAKLSLVSRDEFDRQTQLLSKSRQHLNELETRLAELEAKNNA